MSKKISAAEYPLAKIRSITPRAQGRVEVVAVLEDTRVHSIKAS